MSHYSRTSLLIQLVNVPSSGRERDHLKEVVSLQISVSKYYFITIKTGQNEDAAIPSLGCQDALYDDDDDDAADQLINQSTKGIR